ERGLGCEYLNILINSKIYRVKVHFITVQTISVRCKERSIVFLLPYFPSILLLENSLYFRCHFIEKRLTYSTTSYEIFLDFPLCRNPISPFYILESPTVTLPGQGSVYRSSCR